MSFAVVTLGFDPTLYAGPFAVRWETLGLAAAVFVALLLAAVMARADRRFGVPAGRPVLRLDDLLYLAVAAVPGAVIGGRLVLLLDFLGYYQARPGAILDPGQGSLSLLGAVLGGTLTVAAMCLLLGVPVRRWLDAGAVPLLVAVGLGKLAYLLGGGGQGAAWNGPWALAFSGPGPWLSALASVPAHPSQVYEAAWALSGALVLGLAVAFRRQPAAAGPVPVRPGLRYAVALEWWLLGRVLIGFTWATPPVVAGLRTEQLAALAVLCVVGVAAAWGLGPSTARDAEAGGVEPGDARSHGDGPDPGERGTGGRDAFSPDRDGDRLASPDKPPTAPRRPA